MPNERCLAIYTGDANVRPAEADDATISKGMAAWEKWVNDRADAVFISGGSLTRSQ